MRLLTIRDAEIPLESRELFEQFGSIVIASVLAGSSAPRPEPLRDIYNKPEVAEYAARWLTEQYDKNDRKESWSLVMEAAEGRPRDGQHHADGALDEACEPRATAKIALHLLTPREGDADIVTLKTRRCGAQPLGQKSRPRGQRRRHARVRRGGHALRDPHRLRQADRKIPVPVFVPAARHLGTLYGTTSAQPIRDSINEYADRSQKRKSRQTA